MLNRFFLAYCMYLQVSCIEIKQIMVHMKTLSPIYKKLLKNVVLWFTGEWLMILQPLALPFKAGTVCSHIYIYVCVCVCVCVFVCEGTYLFKHDSSNSSIFCFCYELRRICKVGYLFQSSKIWF